MELKVLRLITVISQHIKRFDCWEIRGRIMRFLSSSVMRVKAVNISVSKSS